MNVTPFGFGSLRTVLVGLACVLSVAASSAQESSLLIYCGTTMVKPIAELARTFEQQEKIKIIISQGASEDLYRSARKSRSGDLYLPGEPSYRSKYLAEGLLGEFKVVGYNQMALFVAKGNPKKVRPDLKELLREDLVLTVGNAESGSVGQESKTMLDQAHLYPKVVSRAAFLLPDSRAINLALKRGDADLALNWRATAFFPDNAPWIDVVDLDPHVAKPQALLLNVLTFSQNPAAATKFMTYVASGEGQAVFRKYGFLDNSRTR